jgi:dipeptidyl aminopeptidase/acylaminoacyl peptidase
MKYLLNKKIPLLIIGTIVFTLGLHAQNSIKRPISTNDFANWKSISNSMISNDGNVVAYELNPQKGDGALIVQTTSGKNIDTISRGFDARFSPESDFIAFKIKQPVDSVRKAKLKKLKKEDLPSDSIGILVFRKNKFYKFPNLKQFELSKENASWIAFTTAMPKQIKKNEGIKDTSEKKKGSDLINLNRLNLLNPSSGDTIIFDHVSEFYYSKMGQSIIFITQTNDSVDETEVLVFDTSKKSAKSIFKQAGTAKKAVSDPKGENFAFLFSSDTIPEKVYNLFVGSIVNEISNIEKISNDGIPIDWAPSAFADISFSENGKRIFFGTNAKPQVEPKDSLLDDEKPMLDIWTWKDKELQPEQKLKLEKEKKRTYQAVYLIESNRVVQLGDPLTEEIRTFNKGNGRFALGFDRSPYQLASSWTGTTNADYYLIEVETGNKTLIASNKQHLNLSPGGNYFVWYNQADSSYYSQNTNSETQIPVKLNEQLPVIFCDELWDIPSEPNPYGIAGWSENDQYIYIYDRYDIWRFDPQGKKVPVNATRNYGRNNQLRLRYERLDPEEEFIDTAKPVILSAFDELNKSEGYFEADLRNYSEPRMLIMEDFRFEKLNKAKNATKLIWTRESEIESPALWSGNLKFGDKHRLSNANPQQDSFIWHSAKLIHWNTFSGKIMEGLLYLPENLNPEKQYPMIVYFYERNSDNLHAYSPPSPSRSTVNRSFFTSNGTIIFIPDITYTDGLPGQSAFDAIVSGTQYVCDHFSFVDRKRIGIQGQSWGGYQTAWIITKTDLFAAAMAGAPVSNMTSAYGGIRWESGKSRMYQYEKTQSRIGGTLWEKPLQYIENSPIFYVPNINTPLLIMHNDTDGAVPWYQGIELFSAMRRLNKPVWMLTYNNEEHNLKDGSWANRMDLTIRMKQFFDHYLNSRDMPPWMNFGIPAIQKGKITGY